MDDDQNTKKVQDVSSDKSSDKPEENKEVEELKSKVKELDNNWKRALADYQNLQKRIISDQQEFLQYGSKNLLVKFLDILDHLEEAEKNLNDKGLELVIKLFKDYLKEEGVSEMERLGEKFDPIYDECLEMRKGDKDNVIIEVARKGYTYKSKVLRVAKVVVEVTKN